MASTLYLGHGLTHAAPDFVERMRLFREKLRERYVILDFLGLGLGTPADVYRTDSGCVERCDVFVAECTHPSIGLGIELQIAADRGKPMLLLAAKGVAISRMALGLPNAKLETAQYDTVEEAIALVENFARKYPSHGQ